MTHTTNVVATWLTILTIIVGGGVWVGGISSDVASAHTSLLESRAQVDKLRDEVPPSIARLEAKADAVQTSVQDIKQSQEEILRELRKK